MTKRQRIDAMREARLWVGQIIVPGVTLAASILTIPEVRSAIALKAQRAMRTAEESYQKSKEKVINFANVKDGSRN